MSSFLLIYVIIAAVNESFHFTAERYAQHSTLLDVLQCLSVSQSRLFIVLTWSKVSLNFFLSLVK